jgi:hypothetical protein
MNISIALTLFCFLPSFAQEGMRHEIFSDLLRKHVVHGMVDYRGIALEQSFQVYLDFLASIDPATLPTSEEQLAFWINAYNAYTIKLIIDRMPLESIRDISLGLPILFGPWSIKVAKVGGITYTLNAIEHDIIRKRYKDPRIHFALVCAARGCPLLRDEAYEGTFLERQLHDDALRFLEDRNRFDKNTKTLFLSKIFDWYEDDFEDAAGSVKAFLGRYVSPADREWIQGDVKIEYLSYDWTLNSR